MKLSLAELVKIKKVEYYHPNECLEVLFSKQFYSKIYWKALFHRRKIVSSYFYLNPKILTKLFNLIYYLILTPTPQLSPNPNCKPHI